MEYTLKLRYRLYYANVISMIRFHFTHRQIYPMCVSVYTEKNKFFTFASIFEKKKKVNVTCVSNISHTNPFTVHQQAQTHRERSLTS